MHWSDIDTSHVVEQTWAYNREQTLAVPVWYIASSLVRSSLNYIVNFWANCFKLIIMVFIVSFQTSFHHISETLGTLMRGVFRFHMLRSLHKKKSFNFTLCKSSGLLMPPSRLLCCFFLEVWCETERKRLGKINFEPSTLQTVSEYIATCFGINGYFRHQLAKGGPPNRWNIHRWNMRCMMSLFRICLTLLFFSKDPTDLTAGLNCTHDGSNDAVLPKEVPFGGVAFLTNFLWVRNPTIPMFSSKYPICGHINYLD